MRNPWCSQCSASGPDGSGCPDRTCRWVSWTDDGSVLVDPRGGTYGGTADGFPALVRTAGGRYVRAWLKCRAEGRGSGLSFEQTETVFRYETSVLGALGRSSSVPKVLVKTRIDAGRDRTALPDLTPRGREAGATWGDSYGGNTVAVWYVMTQAPGTTWSRCEFARRNVRLPLYRLCRALCDLHRRGFGHYDLKPDNVHWDEAAGILQLIDFGFAKGTESWRRESPDHRNDPAVEAMQPGSRPWVAPEWARCGWRELTPESDGYVYGLLFLQTVLDETDTWVGKTFLRASLPVAPDQRTCSTLYSRLLGAGVSEGVARLVVFRLLAPAPQTRKGALEELLAEMERLGWDSAVDRRSVPWGTIAAVAAVCIAVGVGIALLVPGGTETNGTKTGGGGETGPTNPTNVPRSPSTNVPRPPSTNVPRSPSTNVPRSPSTNVPRSPSTNVPRSPSTNVPRPSLFPPPKSTADQLIERWKTLYFDNTTPFDSIRDEMREKWPSVLGENERMIILGFYRNPDYESLRPDCRIADGSQVEFGSVAYSGPWDDPRFDWRSVATGKCPDLPFVCKGRYLTGERFSVPKSVPLFAPSAVFEIPPPQNAEIPAVVPEPDEESFENSEPEKTEFEKAVESWDGMENRSERLASLRNYWNSHRAEREKVYGYYRGREELRPKYRLSGDTSEADKGTFSTKTEGGQWIVLPETMPESGSIAVTYSFRWKNDDRQERTVPRNVQLFQDEVVFDIGKAPQPPVKEYESVSFPDSLDPESGVVPARLTDRVTIYTPFESRNGGEYEKPNAGWLKSGGTFTLWFDDDEAAKCIGAGDEVFYGGRAIGKVDSTPSGKSATIRLGDVLKSGQRCMLSGGGFTISTRSAIEERWNGMVSNGDAERTEVRAQMKALDGISSNNHEWLFKYYRDHSSLLPVIRFRNLNPVSVWVNGNQEIKGNGGEWKDPANNVGFGDRNKAKTYHFSLSLLDGDRYELGQDQKSIAVSWDSGTLLPESVPSVREIQVEQPVPDFGSNSVKRTPELPPPADLYESVGGKSSLEGRIREQLNKIKSRAAIDSLKGYFASDGKKYANLVDAVYAYEKEQSGVTTKVDALKKHFTIFSDEEWATLRDAENGSLKGGER